MASARTTLFSGYSSIHLVTTVAITPATTAITSAGNCSGKPNTAVLVTPESVSVINIVLFRFSFTLRSRDARSSDTIAVPRFMEGMLERARMAEGQLGRLKSQSIETTASPRN